MYNAVLSCNRRARNHSNCWLRVLFCLSPLRAFHAIRKQLFQTWNDSPNPFYFVSGKMVFALGFFQAPLINRSGIHFVKCILSWYFPTPSHADFDDPFFFSAFWPCFSWSRYMKIVTARYEWGVIPVISLHRHASNLIFWNYLARSLTCSSPTHFLKRLDMELVTCF